MNKASHTILPPPPPAHSRRAAHFLKPLPIAALAALLAAPAAWANSGGDSFTDYWTGSAYGGFGSGKTVIYDENSTVDTAYGGYSDTNPAADPKVADKTGKANRNTLTVTGTVDYAFGGAAFDTAGNAEAIGNTLTVKGTVKLAAYGGRSEKGSATGNFVFIDGGKADIVWGGYADGGHATDNTVTLISGRVTGVMRGGDSSDCSTYDCVTGNTLAVQGKDFPVGANVENFDTLNFTLPADIKAGEVMLDVGGNADFLAASTKVSIAVAGVPALTKGNQITLIKAGTWVTITPQLTGTYFKLASHDPLVAELDKPLVPVKVAGSTAEGGEVKCEHPEVAKDIGTTTCTATADTAAGYTFKEGSMTASNGTISECDGAVCKLSGVTNEATVSATFTKAPTPGPTPTPTPYYYSDDSSPTMGELGLLLSGLALAGAAAPALRRREKQGKKADTRQ